MFLDAGGTLIHEHPSRFELYVQAAREVELAVTPQSMHAAMHAVHDTLPREIDGHFRYTQGWFEHFIAAVFVERLGLPAARLATVRARLIERFARPDTYRLFPGALELCCTLRDRGLVVGLISNWSERLPEILRGLGLDRALDFALVSALERREKPEPEIFELALRRAGVRAERAVHLGDDLVRDVHGARALGILPVLIDRSRAHHSPGCATVHDLPEFEQWMLRKLETT